MELPLPSFTLRSPAAPTADQDTVWPVASEPVVGGGGLTMLRQPIAPERIGFDGDVVPSSSYISELVRMDAHAWDTDDGTDAVVTMHPSSDHAVHEATDAHAERRSAYEIVFIMLAAAVSILVAAPPLVQILLAAHGTRA